MKKVQQIDLNGEILKTWDSARTAADSLDLDSSHITKVARGKRNTHGGYRWKFVSEMTKEDTSSSLNLDEIDNSIYSNARFQRDYQEFLNWRKNNKQEIKYTEGMHFIIPDVHCPFENKPFVNAMLNLAADLGDQVKGLHIIGDFADINSLSSHDRGKIPIEGITLGWEYQQCNELLDKFDEAFKHVVDKNYLWGNHCFTEDTELLTHMGWVNLKEYLNNTIDLAFASYNVETDTIEYVQPERVLVKEYDGNIHLYEGNKISVKVTPQHKMMYKPQRNHYRFDVSDNIKDKCVMFKTAWSNVNSDYKEISDQEIRLAAWIHTDGSVSGNTYRIYQSKQDNIKDIRNLLYILDVKHTETTRKRDITEINGVTLLTKPKVQHEFYIHSGEFNWVDEKYYLGEWVFSLSKRQFDIFLEECILGDGSKHKSSPDKSWMLYGKKIFLEQMQILCISNGHSASLVEYRDGDWRLNIHRDKDEAKLNSVKSKLNFSTESYKGLVWCPTTKYGTVISRRNGKVSIQGNCDRYKRYMMKVDNSKLGDALPSPTVAMRLKERGYNVQENWKEGTIYLGRHLELMHGDFTNIHAAKKHIDVYRTSIIFGHIHRFQTYIEGNVGGWSIGWMGDGSSPAFNYASKAQKLKWNNAFAIVNIDEDGYYFVEPILWQNGKFYYGGKCYK